MIRISKRWTDQLDVRPKYIGWSKKPIQKSIISQFSSSLKAPLCHWDPRKLQACVHNNTPQRIGAPLFVSWELLHCFTSVCVMCLDRRTHRLQTDSLCTSPVTIVNYKTKTPTVYKGPNVCVLTQSASPLISYHLCLCFTGNCDVHGFFALSFSRK